MAELALQFSSDHPAAAGHFPGNPIIPGACLLSEALRAIESALGCRLTLCEIGSAKFFHPVRPGDRVAIVFERTGGSGIRFSCAVGDRKVMTGQVTWRVTRKAD